MNIYNKNWAQYEYSYNLATSRENWSPPPKKKKNSCPGVPGLGYATGLIPRFSTSAHTQESLGTRLLKAVSESDLHHVSVFTTKSDTCVCGTHSGSSRVAQLHSVRMASFVLIDSTFSYKDSEKRCTMETFIALVI